MTKNKAKSFQDRVLIGGRLLALGDEKMGKTHLCHVEMAKMIEQAQNGYYAIYLDFKGDTERYNYFKDWRYIKNIKDTKRIKDNAFVLDMFSGGSLKNTLNTDTMSNEDVFIEAMLRLEEVSTLNPKAQLIFFINECHYLFPNIPYNGQTAINKARMYFLQELNHIKTFSFLTTPDTRPLSKLLTARADDVVSFRVADPLALSHIGDLSKDPDSGLYNVPLAKIQKLKPREYVILKSSGRLIL